MQQDAKDMYMEVLLHNKGFNKPEEWVGYARENGFKKVRAELVTECPDCGSRTASRIGQYVYYSNLFGLRSCRCGLVYSDIKLSEEVSGSHFEAAYKDEAYFDKGRRPIYRQIAGLVNKIAPSGGSVLDIGGAQGHLAAMIKELCPGLSITVNDISEKACEYARSKFGLNAICSPLGGIESAAAYEAVLLIDILYYERDLKAAWKKIASLTKGSLVLRMPNKLWLIRLSLFIKRALSGKGPGKMDRVPFFNPEHIYIFPAAYLRKKLLGLGFKKVRVMPSRGLANPGLPAFAEKVFYVFAMLVYYATFRKAVITPSRLIEASR